MATGRSRSAHSPPPVKTSGGRLRTVSAKQQRSPTESERPPGRERIAPASSASFSRNGSNVTPAAPTGSATTASSAHQEARARRLRRNDRRRRNRSPVHQPGGPAARPRAHEAAVARSHRDASLRLGMRRVKSLLFLERVKRVFMVDQDWFTRNAAQGWSRSRAGVDAGGAGIAALPGALRRHWPCAGGRRRAGRRC